MPSRHTPTHASWERELEVGELPCWLGWVWRGAFAARNLGTYWAQTAATDRSHPVLTGQAAAVGYAQEAVDIAAYLQFKG
jgi:hypothetical protein